MEKIYRGSNCMAEYSAENKRIIISFEGPDNISEYNKMSKIIIEQTKNTTVESFILNFRSFTGELVGLNEWLFINLSPAVNNGLKKEAIIMEKDDENYEAAIDVTTKTKLTEAKVFSDLHNAEVWLDSE